MNVKCFMKTYFALLVFSLMRISHKSLAFKSQDVIAKNGKIRNCFLTIFVSHQKSRFKVESINLKDKDGKN